MELAKEQVVNNIMDFMEQIANEYADFQEYSLIYNVRDKSDTDSESVEMVVFYGIMI